MARISRSQILQDFRTRSLLEATRRIIASQGFDAVTMERVAEEAGITKGGIYLYFRDKERLMLAALEEIASEMMRQIESRIDPKAPPWHRLCQLLRAQMDTFERHKDVMRTILLLRWLMIDPRRRRSWRPLLKYRERHLAGIKAILDDGLRRRIFRPMDTATAAFYINEIAVSTTQRRMMGLSLASLEKDLEGLIGFIAVLVWPRRHFPGLKEGA